MAWPTVTSPSVIINKPSISTGKSIETMKAQIPSQYYIIRRYAMVFYYMQKDIEMRLYRYSIKLLGIYHVLNLTSILLLFKIRIS